MDVEVMFTRGREAADRGNYDYAIAVFRDILRQSPEHVKSLITLRGCEITRFQERGGGFKAKLSGFFSGLMPLILMHVKGGSEKKIEECERFLENLPTSIHVLKVLAGAHRAAGHLEAAANTLEFARQRDAGSGSVLEMLGDIYAEKQDFRRAARCFEELEKIRPKDRMISERIRNLRAVEHLHATKMEDSKSYREQVRDLDKAKELEADEHVVRTTDEADAVIARCQAKLKENPNDFESLVKLGDMYVRKEQFKFAFVAYEKALEINPQYSVKVKIGDLKIRQLKKVEIEAAEAAKLAPTNADLRETAKQARKARVDLAIQEHEDRYRDHPTETSLAHELGLLYWERGAPDAIVAATAYFQKSVEDPRFKARAKFMLAQCFEADPKTRDMAIAQYEQALEMVVSPVSETAKSIQYSLGRLYEQGGDKLKALEWYKKVFAVDAGFRDVRKKIEKLS